MISHLACEVVTAVGASFLPLAIYDFGASPETTWRFASITIIGIGGLGLGRSLWRRRSLARKTVRAEPIQSVVVAALNLGGLGLLLSNAFVPGPTSGARYTLSVLFALGIAGVTFVSATFSNSGNHPAD